MVVRIDKWLWAARFFKTRSLARAAVTAGQVHLNGSRVKPARSVQVGDELQISKGQQRFVICIDAIGDRRVSAAIAQTFFTEDPESIAQRLEQGEQRRLTRAGASAPERRPDGRNRRAIRRLKQGDSPGS